ncbi:hypothetical protein ACF05L_15685 [Streptomyces bobili]|uniref:hypothetical protein n=1 Tax=Streptomyces bobili TaxID=67280 RepID=UPI0036F7F42D
MSQSQFFLFVEGKHIDGFVHGNNCDLALSGLKVKHEVVRADEISGSGSGKTRLLTHYELLVEKRQLVSGFKGKTTVAIFFMDKDLDDIRGRHVNSDHVIYTAFYDVENHVFAEGDIQRAVAAACNLSPQRVREELPGGGVWQTRAAHYWQDWVRLCFAANVLKLHGEANYGRLSPLNPKPYGPPDAQTVSLFELRSHALARQFCPNGCQDWESARERVDALYEAGRQDEVFKGKWYAEILARWLMDLDSDIDRRALAAMLVRQVAGTMKFDSQWSRDVQAKILDLAMKAGFRFPKQRALESSAAHDSPSKESEPQ